MKKEIFEYFAHQVSPNESDEDRIVISFNLWIQRK